jgi:hypothetical protein
MSRTIKQSIALAAVVYAAFPILADAQTYIVRRVNEGGMKGYADVHLSRAVMPGQKARVWFATLTNPDCSSAGTMTTQVVDIPSHGHIDISTEKVFPNFVAPNPRVICDRQKVDGVQAFYTADPGFHGHDRVVLENATSEGRIRRFRIDLDVR